jgi:hypothetical protein
MSARALASFPRTSESDAPVPTPAPSPPPPSPSPAHQNHHTPRLHATGEGNARLGTLRHLGLDDARPRFPASFSTYHHPHCVWKALSHSRRVPLRHQLPREGRAAHVKLGHVVRAPVRTYRLPRTPHRRLTQRPTHARRPWRRRRRPCSIQSALMGLEMWDAEHGRRLESHTDSHREQRIPSRSQQRRAQALGRASSHSLLLPGALTLDHEAACALGLCWIAHSRPLIAAEGAHRGRITPSGPETLFHVRLQSNTSASALSPQ